VNLAGTVSPNGLVNVSTRLRERGAESNGRISTTVGAGHWHGNSPNNTPASAPGKPSGGSFFFVFIRKRKTRPAVSGLRFKLIKMR
jgi:hypothetical protein